MCINDFQLAAVKGIRIMRPEWVRDVWNCSRINNISATNDKFKRHILPPFFSKRFTSTGLSAAIKKEIKNLIETNGGTYSGNFSSRNIDILILEPSNVGTDKHKAAESSKIECVTPDWIRDSSKKGYALPIGEYKVMSSIKPPSHSTPDKMASLRFEMADSSILSRIGMDSELSIDETLASNSSMISVAGNANVDAPYKQAMEKLDVRTAKKAGLFLDGCNVSDIEYGARCLI